MITAPLTLKLAAFAAAGATAGGAVLALSPSQAADDHNGQATSQAQHPDRLRAGRFLARHVIHAEWTTANGEDHAAIRGTVTAVSAHAYWLSVVSYTAIGLLLIWMPLYLLVMQKRVYRQGWVMTLLKYSIIGFVYVYLLGGVAALMFLVRLTNI